MRDHDTPVNFDGLLAAWLAKLDTEELNRRFYKALFAWFEKAVECAKFPGAKSITPEEHVIRLITRLLFIWFIKEKRLISEELFIEEQVKRLLKDYDSDTGDSYYRAVLQNLFFATLNTEIGNRGFSSKTNNHHRNFSKYRYKDQIADLGALIRLFAKTPFINGGLFDCLDSEESTSNNGYRIDCFSDNPSHYKQLSIPNRLFFHKLTGLIPLFNRYKFTVEENTPAEQEVALDPELLGKVFENLLAAINPETKQSARKQTGSYYTPRPVVDYMVEESLIATLAQNSKPSDGDPEFLQERIRYLLDYSDAYEDGAELFDEREKDDLVRAIAQIKTLDPAVGSGAFPMGILHKLTLGLRRLDPRNYRWEQLQKEIAQNRASAAFNTQDQAERDEELKQISDTFERYRNSDFGRKLYLIQNSIFGVDIQPVATQIAKLRFFISLAIEQDANNNPNQNYGIKPLPNLETRFVAANTLIGLGNQAVLGNGDRTRIEHQIRENRERHFHASTRQKKNLYRRRDKELRNALSHELQKLGMPAGEADKISLWDPYDQNTSADWFDPQYMFGVRRGFDLVIGNPPYRQVPKRKYSAVKFPYSEGKDKGKQNLYKLFVEQSYNLAKNHGIATLIVQSSLMCDLSSAATRQLLLENTQLQHIVEFPEKARTRAAQIFTTVTQGTSIYQFIKDTPNNKSISVSVGNDANSLTNLRFESISRDAILTLYPDLRCFPLIKEGSVPILERIARDKTIKPLRDFTTNIVQGDLNLTTHSSRFSNTPSPVRLLRGRHVNRFVLMYDETDEYCEEEFLSDRVEANSNETFLVSQQVMNALAHRRLNFALTTASQRKFLWGHSVNKTQLKVQSNSKSFLALLNSKFMDWFFRITSTNNNVQGYELEQLPIPSMSNTQRKQLDNLVNRILQAKDVNPSADTSKLESQIDQLVYQLYGLTPEEITVVERPA